MSSNPKNHNQLPDANLTQAQTEMASFLDGRFPDASVEEASSAYDLLSDGLREMQERPTDSEHPFWRSGEDGAIKGNGADLELTEDGSLLSVSVDDRRFATGKRFFLDPDTPLRIIVNAKESWRAPPTDPDKSSLIYYDLEYDRQTGLPGVRKKIQHWYGPTIMSLCSILEEVIPLAEKMTDDELMSVVGGLATEKARMDEGVDVEDDLEIDEVRKNPVFKRLSDETRNTKANQDLEAELGVKDEGSLVGEEEMRQLIKLLLSKQ